LNNHSKEISAGKAKFYKNVQTKRNRYRTPTCSRVQNSHSSSKSFFKQVETLVNNELKVDFRKLRRNTDFDQKITTGNNMIEREFSTPKL